MPRLTGDVWKYVGTMVSISKTLGKLICWVFQYNICWNFFWKFLGAFLLVPYFQNMIEWVPLTQGYTTYFILGSNIFFLGIIHLINSTYLSKCFITVKTCAKLSNSGIVCRGLEQHLEATKL